MELRAELRHTNELRAELRAHREHVDPHAPRPVGGAVGERGDERAPLRAPAVADERGGRADGGGGGDGREVDVAAARRRRRRPDDVADHLVGARVPAAVGVGERDEELDRHAAPPRRVGRRVVGVEEARVLGDDALRQLRACRRTTTRSY